MARSGSPPLLGLLGDRLKNPEGRWGAIIRRVLRRPGLSVALSIASAREVAQS